MNTKGLPEGGPFFAGAPPHGPTLRLRLVRLRPTPRLRTPHCAPSSLVRGYWNFVPSGLLKENLQSRKSHIANRTSYIAHVPQGRHN